MKYKSVVTLLFLTGLLFIASTKMAYSTSTTKNYADITLSSPNQTTHLDDVWDLTQGDLTLSYTIDMGTVHQPPRPDPSWRPSWWNPAWEPYTGWYESTAYYWSHTLWIEVGMRGVGGSDWSPGPWNTYKGKCGGWMVHDADAYVGEWNGTWWADQPNNLDMDDKISLQASGGRDETDYDVNASAPTTVLHPTIGSRNNYGVWFDRDGVDQWQAASPGAVNGGTYNTNGIYHIVITYHAISNQLGVMFATVNGIPTGFYASPPDWIFPPDYYPAGLSFKADTKQMQVFAGVSASNSDPVLDPPFDYGSVTISNLSVTGYPGVYDPLVPGFTHTTPIAPPYTVQFTDTTHGGMPAYTYSWDFGDGAVSTVQNPTHTYAGPGAYIVELTVTPFRCEPKSDPQTIYLGPPPVGGEWVPLSILQFPALWISLVALLAIAASFVGIRRIKKR